MTGFVVILAALNFAVPVRCYHTDAAFATPDAAAYYQPGEYIALSPLTCHDVRMPNLIGANVLAHELAHVWQDEQGLPFSEAQADRIALTTQRRLLTRLSRLFHRRAVMTPKPDTVFLAP